ncbi:dynamin family protein [Sedimenticola sp.]|uniref:dynamin family protein n=1 Tax=Sedimenticola sp. TaxID=1940285 RepID=UPI003D0D4957
MNTAGRLIEGRLKHLETHLEQENPVLLKTVQSFKKLDRIAYRTGLLGTDESYATQIPWWPLISVLGTFSSGKSTFINHYLGYKLQRTGNQAVDDKFTVTCYSREKTAHALPGVALDSDPRFPFYQMSEDIERVAKGEGERIDSYLQLKTCPSERLRGKILIDSPGFDADAQRTSTLRITDHIIDLSDLVLVFFDARHPEPGAMQDTLDHLVSNTISRNDAGKFLYILNQIDSAAKEDNPEEVVAAWQRALGERGLTAGRFYTIYNPEAAVPIDDENLRQRFERKRDADLEEIHNRMHEVEIERAYRIVGVLERTARDIEERAVPAIKTAMYHWKKRVLWGDALVFGLLLVALFGISLNQGYWHGLQFVPPWLETLTASPALQIASAVGVMTVALGLHFMVRSMAARSLLRSLKKQAEKLAIRGNLTHAFLRNTKPWRSIFSTAPAGWGRSARKRLAQVKEDADNYVQTLNDRFTNPSGEVTIQLEDQAKLNVPQATPENDDSSYSSAATSHS